MSQDANSETEAYDKEYDAFLKQLDEFHQQRGTAFKRLPRINGKGVDLYLLYVVVTARGGWQKVNARNEWEEILEDFRLPAACVNSSVALKQIYMRYLDAYERVTFLGNDVDDKNNDNDDDDSSHPAVRGKKSVRALNVVPLAYNASQHNVAESLREGAKLCTSLFKPSQYDRLCMSLTSPLPNEHDFSFNLCTLLSNEGRQVMHLAQCPRLLEIMLGHVGVFRDDHCQKYFVSNIRNQKGKNLVQFWVDSICDEQKHVLEVLVPAQPQRSSLRGRLELPTSAPGDSGAADMDTSDMSLDSGTGTTGPGEGAGGKGGSNSAGRDASNAVDEGGGGGGGGARVNGDSQINNSDDDRGDRDGKSDSLRENIPPLRSTQTTLSLPVNNKCSSDSLREDIHPLRATQTTLSLPVNNKCSSSSGKISNNNNNTTVNASCDSDVIMRNVNPACSVPLSSSEEKGNASEQSNEISSKKRSENCAVSCLLEKNSKETSDLERDNIYERLKKELGMSDCLTAREEVELFHCGRDSGLQDSEGTRIAQLIHILRNLSFEEDNVATLAQSSTCLRFLVLCLCSRFGGLAVQALDTLGNISHEVILGDPCGLDPRTSSLLLSCVADGVFSEDRARVLRSLEVLNRLAMSDANEDVMAASIRQEVFDQICRYLTVHDIMLLIYTLESLYSLSSLGSASCNAIVHAPGSIHTLVALLTVEAQSYGPGACIGMKVVETVTGVVSDPDAAISTNFSSSTMTTGSTAAALSLTTATPSAALPAHSIATPHYTLPPPSTLSPPVTVIQQPMLQHTPFLSSVVSTPTLAAANAAALQQQLNHNANNNNNINSNTVKTPLKNVMDMKKSVMSSTVASDVEDFVCDWIKRSYEHFPGTVLEQAVVFRHFSSSMHALGKKQGFNPVLLSSCFRKVYGFKVGPTRHNPKDASDKWYYHDLRRRDTPLPMKVNDKLARGVNKVFNSPLCHTPVLARPTPDPSNANMSGSSILKAQLSAPLRPISPAAAPAAPRMMQQQQPSPSGTSSQQVSPISSPPPPYSPNPGLSPRPPNSPSPSSPFSPPPHSYTPPPAPLPPPGGRQENSALIKSLLANKVTSASSGPPSVSSPVVGGLASMLAAPCLLTQPTTNTASPQLTYHHQQMTSMPSAVTQQQQYHYSHHQQTTTSSSLLATTSSSPSMLLPPPPPYPQHKVRQALPSMQVPSILKESPPPLPPSMASTTITSTPTYYTTQADSPTLPPPSSMPLPSFTRHYQHFPTAEQIPSSAVPQDQVSRNIQKQQQQAADSTSNNSTFMADTNGSINNRMLINAAVNGVGFNGEPIKSEEDSSSSLASTMTLDVRKVTSFEGILQNGIATSSELLPPPSSSASHPVILAAPDFTQHQMQQSVNPSAVSTIVQNTFHDPNSISHNQQQSVVVSNTYSSSSCVVSSSNSSHDSGRAVSPNALNIMAPTTIKKNVLADLLEKTLGGDILNGVVDKELRITDNNRMLPNGPIIINNVSVNNSMSPYGVVGTTAMAGGGGLKRPGSEDYDESGAKRLAIDRGDGKITLYVSQNGGDGDGTVIDGSGLGGAPPPQQVVISGHNAMSLLTGGNITAGGQKQQLVTSHGQIISSGTQLVTSSGQLVTGTQLVTSSGQLVTSGGQLVTSSGQLITTGGQLVTSGGEQFVTSCGQLISASGQLVTTQGGQKMVVQGNFGQMLGSGQMVLSTQGGHIVVSGNGSGGEAVLVGGQLIQQGTQLITATTQQGGPQQQQHQQTTHIVGQGTQLVTASGQIIHPGQSHMVGTGGQVVVTQGQIISQGQQPQMISSQGQLIQSQGQVLTHGSTGQIVGGQLMSQGQIVTQGQGQIISQGQIVTQGQGQIMSSQNQGQIISQQGQGQIISQQGQGQIISQGNVQGQIISQGGGQVVLQTSGQIGSQGHSQLMTQGQGQFITQGQGQLITQGQSHIISQGQILTQGQVINSRGQLVAQGQIINSDQCQTASSGQIVQGQILNQSQGQIISQGQGQLVQQGHVIAQGQQGQMVSQVQGQIISQGQVVTQNQRQVINQGPIVSQGQVISQGGNSQLVTQVAGGGTILTQSGGQILGHQTGSTFLVQQTPGAGKTLIILPAGQKVIQQQQPLVVQQQQSSIPSGGQVLQVVTNSSGSSSIMRTIAAGTIITTTTTSSVPGGSISGGVHFTGAQQQQHMAHNSQVGQQHNLAGPLTTTSLPHHIPTSSIIQQPPYQLQQPPLPQPAAPHVPAPQILASGIVRRHPSNSNMVGVLSNPPKPGGLQYLCEWRGCNCVFASPQQVYHHVCKVHCPPHLAEVQCQWVGCDPMVRKRFSAMTHLHDRHCNEQLLNILAVRRQQIATTGKTELPVPHAPPPHPGYAPNAAFHAIKRHALEVITQRDVVENEGPVTKSIRLTSALILRNLVIYSNSGRKLLRGYESELCNVAISTLESSRTVAQILHDIHLTDQ